VDLKSGGEWAVCEDDDVPVIVSSYISRSKPSRTESYKGLRVRLACVPTEATPASSSPDSLSRI
jgi:hypothetical protein